MEQSGQDFSADAKLSGQENKYGFSAELGNPPVMYPGMHMPGYYPTPVYPPVNENPLQDLMALGYKDVRFTETAGTPTEPFGVVLKIEGIDKTFTAFGQAKKKARKAAAQYAYEFLCDPANLPEEANEKSPINRTPYMHPMYPNPWGPMAFSPRYPSPHNPQFYHAYNQYAPLTSPAPKKVPKQSHTNKDTPFSILREKYPDALIKTQATTTVTIGDHVFPVTIPGNNPHLSRMHACVAALKELEGLEFPDWEYRLGRIKQNSTDPNSISLHPVTLLLKEFGAKNVTFQHDLITDPCTVTINDSGRELVYISDVLPTKRQAKYEASILAIKGIGLDKKYTNILPYGQEDRKRKLNETPAEDNTVAELGEQMNMGLGVEEHHAEPEVVEMVPPKPEASAPQLINEVSPIPDKRMRTDPLEDKPMETETIHTRRQDPRAQSSRYSRYAGGRGRGNRNLIRVHRGQMYGSQKYL
ncbi:hypothetical protein LOD99_2743 [Oopsacas minuta]|uniref:DRBM domain-containing protein n=1 Tax=Oopsacas minuta TaxID=111878 RepID=A0AAV7K2C9_9METZ|nr:hypothetical protein LOD99_2743 [Oopsacas minuta]